MVFASLLFLYAFLPLFLGCYYLAPRHWRNAVALVASVIFYIWGEPVFAGILLLASLVVYLISLGIDRLPVTARRPRQWLLALGLIASLALLVYCKYSNFFVARLNGLLGLMQQGSIVWTAVALPIGVSFFTFQKISYLVDVYRGTARPSRSLLDFLLYVMLFPQLIAGPIIRYHDIAGQIQQRDYTLDRFLSGVWRFLIGLGRKVLIANPLGLVADRVFGHELVTLPTAYAWVGILCYTFQIYFDFAGYSDMAIGLARMMGFEFIENFNRPYTARTVTEFWRRWHISLTNFMRDYVYIPLGGNRSGAVRTSLNLWLVFLVSGFWHGASSSFITWGVYHGSLLSIERAVGPRRLGLLPAVLGTILTFILVLLGWVLFRTATWSDAIVFIQRLADWGSWHVVTPPLDFVWPEVISRRATAVLLGAAVISFIPDRFWQRYGWEDPQPRNLAGGTLRAIIAAACLVLASAALAGQSYNPFIYFRF
ncbi:MAG: MBOAT family protein [Opitutales bacterium]|nr:MBOAT family protein [Opitutales bacterium]